MNGTSAILLNEINLTGIREKRRTYIMLTLLIITKMTQKKLWDIINAQTGKGGKDSGPEALNVAGELISDPKIIANEFNNYFSNIGPQMKSKIPTSNIINNIQFLNMADSSLASMYLRPTTSPEVEKTILTLKIQKLVAMMA